LKVLKEGLDVDEILLISAKTRVGINELWSRIESGDSEERVRSIAFVQWPGGKLYSSLRSE